MTFLEEKRIEFASVSGEQESAHAAPRELIRERTRRTRIVLGPTGRKLIGYIMAGVEALDNLIGTPGVHE